MQDDLELDVDALNYPVLCIDQHGSLKIRDDAVSLVATTTAGLKIGLFKNLRLIDSCGTEWRIKNANKTSYRGPMWGLTMFLNQKISVRFVKDGEPRKIALTELKDEIAHCINSHTWKSRGDWAQLKRSVTEARSVPELLEKLRG